VKVAPGSALDFSHRVPRHASAGELGRVIVNSAGKFAFAQRPKIPARFFGVDLCFTAQPFA